MMKRAPGAGTKRGRIPAAHRVKSYLLLELVRAPGNDPPPGVVRMLTHRPELFGEPLSNLLHQLVQGACEWTLGERELFAAFTARLAQCAFFTTLPGAVTSLEHGLENPATLLETWRDSGLRPPLKAMLAFLEKMTLRPDELGPADAEAVRAAGVSDAALENAVHVCAAFNMIARLGDAAGLVEDG